MSKGSSAPAPPDPDQTARAESQYNRLDTFGPDGSGVRHGHTDPTSGAFILGLPAAGSQAQAAQTFIESGAQKAIREMADPASVALTEKVIADNITALPEAPRVGDRGTVAESVFDRSLSMIQPQIDRGQDRLLTNLQNRGIPVGSEAFERAYSDQQRTTEDTIARLAMDADVAAGQEQSRQFGLDLTSRQNAVSEIVAALGGNYAPVSNLPSGQASQINYAGLVSDNYQNRLNAYNQEQANRAQTASALGSLGGALIKSDENVKDVGQKVCVSWAEHVVEELRVMTWAYKAQPDRVHVGPMAQDFQRLSGLGSETDISTIDYLGVLTVALQGALQRITVLEDILLKHGMEYAH